MIMTSSHWQTVAMVIQCYPTVPREVWDETPWTAQGVSWLTFVVLKSFQHVLDIHEPGRLVKQIGKLYTTILAILVGKLMINHQTRGLPSNFQRISTSFNGFKIHLPSCTCSAGRMPLFTCSSDVWPSSAPPRTSNVTRTAINTISTTGSGSKRFSSKSSVSEESVPSVASVAFPPSFPSSSAFSTVSTVSSSLIKASPWSFPEPDCREFLRRSSAVRARELPATKRTKSQRTITKYHEISGNMGLSENRVYSQWNSHVIGIMISKTIGFRGTLFSDTPKYHENLRLSEAFLMLSGMIQGFFWDCWFFGCDLVMFIWSSAG